ncbi:hypothetical protein COB55_00400 [Candidatus Wolfebacteria bacterium]|nr:MAG: hypothetical protein COB55_00400 [Candidatus Wolfebacteria bacterium]
MQVLFEAQSEEFIGALGEYKEIWTLEGEKIISALEKNSGKKFNTEDIQVIIYEGISRSGREGRPMMLRASYTRDVKLGTLVHELGHRLQTNTKDMTSLEVHMELNVYLYPTWVELYGEEFADIMVEIESSRTDMYKEAWNTYK